MNSFLCHDCGKIYKFKNTLVKHLQNHSTSKTMNKKRIRCCLCSPEKQFHSYDLFQNHLREEHEKSLHVETFSFKNEFDFYEWKRKVEVENVSNYVKDSGQKRLKDGSKNLYFYCHRSIDNSHDPSPSGAKKKSKAKGSNKTGISCVARIKASVYDSHVKVEYCSTHIGHECEIGRQRLHKEQRLQLAERLSSGVPITQILSDIRENAGDKIDRFHLLTRDDLHNITRGFNLSNGQRLTISTTTKDKLTERIKHIHDSHTLKDSVKIRQVDDVWVANEKYKVKRSKPENICCELLCDMCQICVHAYVCSCPDNMVQHNICKHIHQVTYTLNSSAPSTSQDETIQLQHNTIEEIYMDDGEEDDNIDIFRREIIAKTEMILGYANSDLQTKVIDAAQAQQIQHLQNQIIAIYEGKTGASPTVKKGAKRRKFEK